MPQPTTRRSEENDVPFFKTELGNQPVTTGKPLDASDEPGRADAEMAQDEFEKEEMDWESPSAKAGGAKR